MTLAQKLYDPSPLGATDAGADRDAHPRPCCHRMTVAVDGQPIQTWCVLADGHHGAHESPVRSAPKGNEFGPEQAKQRRY